MAVVQDRDRDIRFRWFFRGAYKHAHAGRVCLDRIVHEFGNGISEAAVSRVACGEDELMIGYK